jgi:nicotinamidase-related amidase
MTTALLVMDVQNGIVARFGADDGLLDRLAQAVAAARAAADVEVVYVRVAFREGFPEVAASNKSFSALSAQSGAMMTETAESTQIHPAVAPAAGEPVITKRRVSALAGTDLAEVLRGRRADTLVLTGIATSGCVLSTLRQAADLDYRLVVLADACADGDPEVHRVLTEKVFPRQAEVLTVAEWTAQLAQPA